MKKIIIIALFICLLISCKNKQEINSIDTAAVSNSENICVSVSSADIEQSRFSENGRLIDTMFIDSKEGLNVREKPELSANKKCILPDRFPVKIVAVGNKDTIDGITDFWIEIVIPRYESKSKEPEYGWIFGGYLSKHKLPVQYPTTQVELLAILKSCLWSPAPDGGYILDFSYDEYKTFNLLIGNPNETCNLGHYTIISKNEIQVIFPDWEEQTIINSGRYIVNIGERFLSLKNKDTDEYFGFWQNFPEGINSFKYYLNKQSLYAHGFYDENDENGYPILGDNFVQGISVFEEDPQRWSNCHDSSKDLQYCVDIAIKYGVSAESTKYEQQYRDYWDPIMKTHQEKMSTVTNP